MMMLSPGAQHRSPSEEALLYHLEYDTKREGLEELTLRTFSEGDRGPGHGTPLQKENRSEEIARQKPMEAMAMRLPGHGGEEETREEMSKSFGRRSMDTFITARATLGFDPEKDKPACLDSVVIADDSTSSAPMVIDDTQDMVEQSDSIPAVKTETVDEGNPPMAGMIWRLGSWVYESLPSIRGVPGSGPAVSPAVEVGSKESAETPVRDLGFGQLDKASPGETIETRPEATDMPVVVLSSGDISVPEDPSPPGQSAGWMGSMYLWRGAKKETSTGPSAAADIAPDVGESHGKPAASQVPSESAPAGSRIPSIAAGTDRSPTEHVSALPADPVRAKEADSNKTAVDETTPAGKTWASRFRSSLVRDPVIDALSKSATAAEKVSLPDAPGSRPLAAASQAADKSAEGVSAPAGEGLPDGLDANRNPESASTSSGWWFARRTSGISTGNKSPLLDSESRMTDTLEGASNEALVKPNSTQSPAQPEKGLDSLNPATARTDRRASIIVRKNQILPSWNTTFRRPPRSTSGIGGLPKLELDNRSCWKGIRRVVVIGVHGWFPNTHIQKCVQIPLKAQTLSSYLADFPPS